MINIIVFNIDLIFHVIKGKAVDAAVRKSKEM